MPVPKLSEIKHVIVVMLENRSFDNMLGWLYADRAPKPNRFLPEINKAPFDGLNPGLCLFLAGTEIGRAHV